MNCFDLKCKPLKCTKCGSTDIDEITKDTINMIRSEFECVCKQCNQCLGYWAYGSYDPCYYMSYLNV